MPTYISDLTAAFLEDISKSESEISAGARERYIRQSITFVNEDLTTSFDLIEENDQYKVDPDPQDIEIEIIILRAVIAHAEKQALNAGGGTKFKSDKQEVDKSKAQANWSEILKRLWKRYNTLAGNENPDYLSEPTPFAIGLYESQTVCPDKDADGVECHPIDCCDY